MKNLKCPKPLCLTKLFPIYQNKHWTKHCILTTKLQTTQLDEYHNGYQLDPIFFELSKNFLDPVHCAAGRQIEAAMAWMAAVCLLQTQAHCVQGE